MTEEPTAQPSPECEYDLLPQEIPESERDAIIGKLKSFPAIQRKNLILKICKFWSGQTQSWEENRLRDLELLPAASLPPKPEESESTGEETEEQLLAMMYDKNGKLKNVRSKFALSKRLALHYKGRIRIKISPTQISDWSNYPDQLPEGAPPPPKPKRNEHLTQKWADWFDKYMLPHYAAEAVVAGAESVFDLSYKSRREKAAMEREELELERIKKSTSERWMESATALGTIGGFAHWIGLQQDKFVEDKQGIRKIIAETLLAINPQLTPEFMTAFDVQLAAKLAVANDAMKKATTHKADEFINGLLEKRKKEIMEAQ